MIKFIQLKFSKIAKRYFNKNDGYITYDAGNVAFFLKRVLNLQHPYVIIGLSVMIYFFSVVKPYEFTGEEPLRVIVAYEMYYSGNFLQPTFLGDFYLNKPPLFNWFIIFVSYFVGWSELTARIVTLFFLSLTAIGIYKFSFELTKNESLSVLSSLIYLSFLDILFWYGNFGEIDVTLGFFIFLIIYFLYRGYKESNNFFLVLSGIITGVAFLLKGFPSYLFFGLTYLAIIIFYRDWKQLFNKYIWIGGILSLIIPALWIINTPEPSLYLKTLFSESMERGKGTFNPLKFIYHIFVFLSLNFKQLLPASLFVALAFLIYRKQKIKIPDSIKVLIFIVFINYIPYLILVETRGRYILPLFPIIAVIFGYIMYSFKDKRIFKVFVYTILLLILARLLIGYIHFPAFAKRKISQKEVVYSIAQTIDINKKIAFDCHKDKFITAYLEFMRVKPFKKSKYVKDWEYLLTCEKIKTGKLIKEYPTQAKTLYLYKR